MARCQNTRDRDSRSQGNGALRTAPVPVLRRFSGKRRSNLRQPQQLVESQWLPCDCYSYSDDSSTWLCSLGGIGLHRCRVRQGAGPVACLGYGLCWVASAKEATPCCLGGSGQCEFLISTSILISPFFLSPIARHYHYHSSPYIH